MSSLSFSLRGGDGGTCGRSEFSRLAELIYACVPLFLLHQVFLPRDVAQRAALLNFRRASMILIQVGPRARRFEEHLHN